MGRTASEIIGKSGKLWHDARNVRRGHPCDKQEFPNTGIQKRHNMWMHNACLWLRDGE